MRPESLTRWGLALLLASTSLTTAGCGRNTGLALKILTPPDDDPFSGAATVVLTLQGDQTSVQQTTATVMSGHFEAKLEISDPSRDSYVYVKVEALDGNGQPVGRGRTPMFVMPQNDEEVTIYVGRPGQMTSTAVRLPDDGGSQATPVGRRLLAAAGLRGIRTTPTNEPSRGVLVVGGLNESAQPMAHAWQYNLMLHNFVDSGSSLTARHGAVMVPSADAQTGHQAIMWGGADGSGKLLTAAEKFDPQVSDIKQVWAVPPEGLSDAGPPGAYSPTAVEVKENQFLITGGSNQMAPTGALPLPQAVLVQRVPGATSDMPAKLGVTRLSPTGGMGPMLSARFEHSANAVTLTTEGTAALLFGGLSYTDRTGGARVAELFIESSKAFIPFEWNGTPPASRSGHVAVTLRSGKVLIAGGYSEDGTGKRTALDSALIIEPANKTFVERTAFLKTARYGATINLLTTEVLICGGFDEGGVPLKTCEQFTADDKLDRIGDLFNMPRARAGHHAIALEIDQVFFVGGVGDGMKPLSEIDIYTAR